MLRLKFNYASKRGPGITLRCTAWQRWNIQHTSKLQAFHISLCDLTRGYRLQNIKNGLSGLQGSVSVSLSYYRTDILRLHYSTEKYRGDSWYKMYFNYKIQFKILSCLTGWILLLVVRCVEKLSIRRHIPTGSGVGAVGAVRERAIQCWPIASLTRNVKKWIYTECL